MHPAYVCLFSCAAALLLHANSICAKPVEAVLCRGGSFITEHFTEVSKDGKIIVQLPSEINVASVSFHAENAEIRSVDSANTLQKPISRLQIENKIADLKQALVEVRVKLATIESERNVYSSNLFPLGEKQDITQNIHTFRDVVREELAVLEKKELALREEEANLNKQIAKLQAELGSEDKNKKQARNYVVTLGKNNGSAKLVCSYFFKGAQWEPAYRIEAMPKKGNVTIHMDAVLSQSSGMDWEGVNITLSSAQNLQGINPGKPRKWIISERMVSSERRMAFSESTGAVMSNDGAGYQAEQTDTGMVYALGKQDLPCTARHTVPVSAKSYQAGFFSLVRPSQSSKAWFAAELKQDTGMLYPHGNAVFLSEGVQCAYGDFSLDLHDKTVYLGEDQLVTVEESRISPLDESSKRYKRTMEWNKQYFVKNGHDKAVEIRLEAPAPNIQDSRIKADVEMNPAAVLDAKTSCYVWNFSAQPKAEAKISYKVSVTIPEKFNFHSNM